MIIKPNSDLIRGWNPTPGIITSKQLWTKQPQYPVKPFRSRAYVIDGRSNRIIPTNVAGIGTLFSNVGRFGIARKSLSNGYASYYEIPATTIGTGDFTVGLFVDLRISIINAYQYLFGSNATYLAVFLRHASVNNHAGMLLGLSTYIDTGVVPPETGLHKCIFARRNGVIYWNVNGVKGSIANTTSITSISKLTLNSYKETAGYGAGAATDYYLAVFEDRAWSEIETDNFIENPWQIFAPKEEKKYFLPPLYKTIDQVDIGKPEIISNRRIWTQQPQYPVGIDRGHPLGPFCDLMYNGATNYDAVHNAIGTTNPARIPSKFGIGPNTSASGISLGGNRAVPGGSYTIFALAQPIAWGGSASHFLFHGAGGVAGHSFGVSAGYQLTLTLLGVASYTIGANLYDAALRIRPMTVVVDGSTATFYLDGYYYAQATIGSQIASSGYAPLVQKASVHTLSCSPLVARFTRALSKTEVKSLSDNPWQIFAPKEEKKCFLPPLYKTIDQVDIDKPEIISNRRIWTQQPQASVRVNWSNPITRGLQLWQLPQNGNNYLNTKRSRTQLGELGKTTVSSKGWAYGQSLSSYGTLTDTNTNTASAHTIFTIAYAVDNNQYPACGFRNVANNSPSSVFISLGGVPYYRVYMVSADRTFTADSTPPVNTFYTFAGVNTGSAQAIFLNGMKQTAIGSYSGGGLSGWNYWNNYGPNSKQVLSLFWDRALSDTEITSLSDNPWQIFAPKEEKKYFLPPLNVTTADYISSSTAGQIAQVGLETASDPGDDNNHVFTYSARSDGDRGLIAKLVQIGSFPSIVTSKQPWRSQPQYPVGIDWSNPITRGLQIAVDCYGNSFGIKKIGAVTKSAGYTTKATITGIAVDGMATTPGFIFNLPSGFTNLSQITIVTVAVVLSRSSPTTTSVFNGHNGGLSSYSTGHNAYQYNAGADIFASVYHYPSFNGCSTLTLNNAVPVSGRLVIASSFRNAGNITAYINGKLVGQSAAGAFNANLSYSATTWAINTTAQGINTQLSLIFDRELSTTELASITQNPWQIFKPRIIKTYFDLGQRLIAAQTPILTTVPTDYTLNLTSGEAALITDYSKLGFEWEAT